MSARGRDAREEQRFRNIVAALVIGGIVLTIAVLYAVLLSGDAGVVSAVCTVAFLAVVFVAVEYLMKPGYGFLHRRPGLEDEEPRSPRPP